MNDVLEAFFWLGTVIGSMSFGYGLGAWHTRYLFKHRPRTSEEIMAEVFARERRKR